eukprot:Nk52_evm25s2568 gene=Nk52_evmTU25s2568
MGPSMEKVKKVFQTKAFMVWILVAIYMFSRAFDRVIARRWTLQMKNYSWFASSILFSFGVWIVSLILLCGAWLMGRVPKSSRLMNQWPYIIAAVLDGSNALLDITAQPMIAGQLANAISQSIIPFTMIVSYFALHRRYQPAHYLAAFLIIYGICLNMQPAFEGKDLTVQGPNNTTYNTSIWFVLLDLVAWVPAAFSNCYKEYTLKGKNISFFWFMVFNGFYQCVWGFATIPYAFISWPEPKGQDASPDTLGAMMKHALGCFVGIRGPNDTDEECNEVYLWFPLFLVFNIIFNVTFLKISKEVSAAFAAIVAAGTFILTDFLFLSPALSDPVQPMHSYTVFAMIAVAMGVAIYGMHKELNREGEELDFHSGDEKKDNEPYMVDESTYDNAEKKV